MYKRYKKNNYLNLNNIFHTEISDNISVVTEEIPSAETFSLGFFYDVGSRDEPTNLNGIAHFIEHCAFRRTNKYSSRQIASKFESLGAYANAYTTQENTSYYVRALKQHFLPILKLLNDITRNTVFDQRDIEKERQIILEEIKSYDDDPEESIFDYGDKILFGTHPMGSSILGSEEYLNLINIEELSNFHNKHYKSGKLVISYTGPDSHNYVVQKAKTYLNFQDYEYIPSNRIAPPVLSTEIINIDKTQSQSHLLMGARIPGHNFDTKYPLPLFNILFGDGMSSRLYQNLRDKHGIAYTIYSTLQIHSDCGIFYIYAASDKNKLNKTEKLISEEIDKFLNKPLKESELHRSKEQLKSSIIMELESLSTRMQSIAKSVLTNSEFENIYDTINIIDSLKANDIKDTVAKYISTDKLSKVRFIGSND